MAGRSREHLAGLLLQVEAGLDGRISLATLAREAGYSPFHFHRLFSQRLGETPARHVQRLRLERAAYLVAVTEGPLIDIALTVGFQTAETFARAFRRRFGQAPRDYRRAARARQNQRAQVNRDFRGEGCQLSEVRFVSLKPATLISLRRLGPYGQDTLPPFSETDRGWTVLEAWAKARDAPYLREAWGFYPDDPNITPQAQLRADICLPVTGDVADELPVRRLAFEGGAYAVIEHLGPYETLDQAYRGCADGIRRSSRYVFREGPPLQVNRRWGIDGDPAMNLTEVAFPVARRR